MKFGMRAPCVERFPSRGFQLPSESLHSPEEEGSFPWGSDSTVATEDEEHLVGHWMVLQLGLGSQTVLVGSYGV